MARLVKKTAHEPALVGDVKICMCGLSINQPVCDKSHLKSLKEDDNKLYWYDGEKVEEIVTNTDYVCGDCSEGKEKSCCGDDSGCCGQCSNDKYQK